MSADAAAAAVAEALPAVAESARRPVSIVIHGGAWAIPDAIYDESQAGVATAARIGFEVLRAGGSAVDAVQVRSMLPSHRSGWEQQQG